MRVGCQIRSQSRGEWQSISIVRDPQKSIFEPYGVFAYSGGTFGGLIWYPGGWPQAPDGIGFSLSRIVPENYGNDVANWEAAVPSPEDPNP
ncbi:MAG: hypothetical protein ACYSOT_06840 [Planctomycetota bacterium]